jgi:hypothetical protein
MTAPDGRDSPSSVGVFLIWQQPHPIHLAELVYRQRPDRRTLERYRELVFESATFMASYAVWKEVEQRFVLGPPLIPAQEIHSPQTTFNPGFELAYWRFGLETAQRWRERSACRATPNGTAYWSTCRPCLRAAVSTSTPNRLLRHSPGRSSGGITRRCSHRAGSCRARRLTAR